MGINIVFGTRKVARIGAYQKHEDRSIVTIEGQKGAGRSRRMLFNVNSMETLGLEEGSQQEILFGFVEQDESGSRKLLIANVTGNPDMAEEVTYKTSKNKTAYDDSKERGKGIASAKLMQEINDFLGAEEDKEHEFALTTFQEEGMPELGIDLYEMVMLTEPLDEEVNGAPFDENLYEAEAVMEEKAVIEDDVKPIRYPEGTRIDTNEDEF